MMLFASLLFYVVLTASASYRYGSVIANPIVAWSALELAIVDAKNSKLSEGENTSKYGLGENLAKLESAKPRSRAHTYESSNNAADDQLTDAESSIREMAALEGKYQKSDESGLPNRVSLQPLDVSANQLQLAKESSALQEARDDALVFDPESVPTQQQINELLAKSASASQQQGVIPISVLNKVEQSTGISPEEVQALLDQE